MDLVDLGLVSGLGLDGAQFFSGLLAAIVVNAVILESITLQLRSLLPVKLLLCRLLDQLLVYKVEAHMNLLHRYMYLSLGASGLVLVRII